MEEDLTKYRNMLMGSRKYIMKIGTVVAMFICVGVCVFGLRCTEVLSRAIAYAEY